MNSLQHCTVLGRRIIHIQMDVKCAAILSVSLAIHAHAIYDVISRSMTSFQRRASSSARTATTSTCTISSVTRRRCTLSSTATVRRRPEGSGSTTNKCRVNVYKQHLSSSLPPPPHPRPFPATPCAKANLCIYLRPLQCRRFSSTNSTRRRRKQSPSVSKLYNRIHV